MDDPVETKLRKAAQDWLDAIENRPDDAHEADEAAAVLRVRALFAALAIDRLRAELAAAKAAGREWRDRARALGARDE